jgi:hypothetical protein
LFFINTAINNNAAAAPTDDCAGTTPDASYGDEAPDSDCDDDKYTTSASTPGSDNNDVALYNGTAPADNGIAPHGHKKHHKKRCDKKSGHSKKHYKHADGKQGDNNPQHGY